MKSAIKSTVIGAAIFALLTGCAGGAAEAESISTAEQEQAASISASQGQAAPTEAPEAPGSFTEVPEEPISESAEEAEASLAEPQGVDQEAIFQDYLEEPPVAELYAEVAEQYTLMEYTDPETGLTVPYYLFVPEQADTEACPMVMFIGDATCTGSQTEYSLSQGYGGIVWAAESEQEKHPCFVLVPAFPETVIDDNNGETVTDYVNLTVRLVETVAGENNVDTDRIYATGQSMGCMTSLYLAANYPELFAAELFVSGQWNIEQLQGLETQTFFYIAAGGDPKASQGQANVMADLDSKGVPYSASYDWDAKLGDGEMEDALRAEIEEGNAINFGQFTAGTVMEANPRGMEHMSSFDCAYKLDAVRNWLFLQSK